MTYGLRLLLKTTSGYVFLQQLESMMFTAHVVTKGHRAGYTGSGPPPVAMEETENCAVAGVLMILVSCTETSDWSVPWTCVTGRSHDWILVLPSPTWLCGDVHDSHCP